MGGTVENLLKAVTLPFEWSAWIRVSSAQRPQVNPVAWPASSEPVVIVDPTPVDNLDGLETSPPDLLVTEVDDVETFERVVDAVASGTTAALVFLSETIARQQVAIALGRAPELMVVPTSSITRGSMSPGHYFEELVRRRVERVLLAWWRLRLEHFEKRLLDHGVPSPPVEREPSRVLSLGSVDHRHLSGLLGLLWSGPVKPAQHLEIDRGTVGRLRTRLPAALKDALESPVSLNAKPLSLLLVEDELSLAASLKRLFERLSGDLDREIIVSQASSARAARAWIDKNGAPDILWTDIVMETPRAGVELVAWLREGRHGSVVVGKTALAPPEDVAALSRLGALFVWDATSLDDLRSLLHHACRALDDGMAIEQLGERVDASLSLIVSGLDDAASSAEAVRGAVGSASIIRALETDLTGLSPEGTGASDVSLALIRTRTAKLAVELCDDNQAAAARALGIDARTLRKLLG